jgi:D-serine deaminase-like pyridoxal phosphate-dependent protein
MAWFTVNNIDQIDSPALVIYPERVRQNIKLAIEMIKDVNKLRPHVKTCKIAEVCRMMQQAGISKFKCATIAEAEMLAQIDAKDVLLAYQPVGPKAKRLLSLVQTYPQTGFSCLVDNLDAAAYLSQLFSQAGINIAVSIDLNTGMNRSGIKPASAFARFEQVQCLPNITVRGLHVYDGHLTHTDLKERKTQSDLAFQQVTTLAEQIRKAFGLSITIVAGGSPSFPTHMSRNVECSPGTFVFWDWDYKHSLPDEPFDYAALVITRIISIVDSQTIAADLGHKSVAAERPLPRVHFLNAPDAMPLAQSEEHLVIKVENSDRYKVGDVLYGVPVHICPTVALYEKAVVVESGKATHSWKVIARDRTLTI